MLNAHYAFWVRRDLAGRFTGLKIALEELGGKPSTIIETGTSAWGIDSSRLFDAYVKNFGGEFITIDLRSAPGERLKGQLSSQSRVIVRDSVLALEDLSQNNHQLDLLFLDSYDLDWSAPEPSASHCLKEWNAARKMFRSGTIVVIDDTPAKLSDIPSFDPRVRRAAERYFERHKKIPGKGALILEEIQNHEDIEVLHHGYNVVLRVV